MAWWQKKLLQYGLLRSGLFEDGALNLDDLDISWGSRSVVELRDVALSGEQIGKLAQLPPSLRVESARVLSLRLTIPADLYQSGVEVDVDGVELTVKLKQDHDVRRKKETPAASPTSARSPQHRKVHRRLRSPPPSRLGGLSGSNEEVPIPTAEELARSFLLEEPAHETRALEASVAANTPTMDESFVSVSSESGDIGTGAPISLPGFLAGFLQGMKDRVQGRIRNVDVRLETEVAGDGSDFMPITLRLRVGAVELKGVDVVLGSDQHPGRRNVEILDVSIDLLSDATAFSLLSEMPSSALPTSTKRGPGKLPSRGPTEVDPAPGPVAPDAAKRSPSVESGRSKFTETSITAALDADHPGQREEEGVHHHEHVDPADFDIKPGDDNVSWTLRRSKESTPVENLWSSMASDDDLPDSLLLDRAPTPRATGSGRESSESIRSRRAVCPYDRSFQSPGSWPQLEESLERRRSQQSPGSWPMLDQSQQSMYQPLTPGPAMEVEDPMNNKRTALEASIIDADSPGAEPPHEREREDSPLEDMVESRLYSHEEAESLYMSAMTQSPQPKIPGGWASEGLTSERSASPENQRHIQLDGVSESWPARLEPTMAGPEDGGSGNATPRAQSPCHRTHKPQDDRLQSKQLLSIDQISVWIPKSTAHGSSSTASSAARQADIPATPARHGMPGTFSTYSEIAASRRSGRSLPMRESSDSTERSHTVAVNPDESKELEAQLGFVLCTVDLASCRLLHRLVSAATASTEDTTLAPAERRRDGSAELRSPSSTPVPISAGVKRFRLSLLEDLTTSHESIQDVGLVDLECTNTSLHHSSSRSEVRIGRLQAWISGSELLACNRQSTLGDSALLTDATPDLAVKFVDDKVTVQNRPVSRLTLEVLPLKLNIDLGALNDTFGSFGGLSGFLELSNSFLSEGGPLGSPTRGGKPVKGVRFAGESENPKIGREVKINGRIAGADVTLRAEACAVNLRSSTIKIVFREHASSVTVGHVLLTGPHLPSQSEVPITADLAALSLDYSLSPSDKDLERLLCLLTPSKDKYDNDDDILLDTLFRQRKKGAVARLVVDDFKLKLDNFECLTELTALGAELSKLAAVAKYLPQDERPGLLSLVRANKVEAQLPVNESFGKLRVVAGEFHCAHVGLPALIALSVDSLKATWANHEDLVHPLVPLTGGDNLPMLMARMLGDEAEPTVKIKVFNTSLEYNVPTLLALTGSASDDVEGLVTDLTQSVADTMMGRVDSDKSSPASDTARSSRKRTNVDLLVHDSALGLTPENQSSKGLLVFTDTKFTTLVPPGTTMNASLELRKAAMFVTDDRDKDNTGLAMPTRGAPSNTTASARLSAALAKQGFVSVGSIMSAKILVRIEDAEDGAPKSVTVDMSNELLLLETCADSTQTLFAVLGGLTSPAPASKQPKYLIEPMTIEDMMASFTGEPAVEPQAPPETLFDVEEEPTDDDPDMLLNASMLGERTDDLLMESEMTESLYGPVSGMLGGVDNPDGDDEIVAEDFVETAESLLEDDPFEMALSPTDVGLSDSAFLRDLVKQCKPAVDARPVDLSLYEVEDLGLDAIGAAGQTLGFRHRFNTPTAGRRKLVMIKAPEKLPFRFRLRDTHLIWNLYDGYDWRRTRDGITQVVEQVEARAEEKKAQRRRSHNVEEEEQSVIGDFLFNSIYVGVPATHDAQDLRRQINRGIDDLASETESVPLSGMSRPTSYSASGRPLRQQQRRRLKLERSKAHKIAFELKGVSADVLVYPPEVKNVVSDIDIRVRDLEVFDNVPTSTWRKFLTCLDDGANSREMSKPMAHIEVNNVRTLQDLAASELVIHASILPLRLHVDQDALDFIVRFFEFKDDRMPAPSEPAEQPFIQRLEVDTVDLRLDYKPKRIDYGGLRSGHTNELMNMISLDAASIRLRHAIVYGIKGFEPLHKTLNDIWMPDVKRNQLPTVLAGLAPVRGLVNIGSGVRDVVAIPVREYRKDGRIVRSIQKGALQFGKTTTSELARFGAKLAIGTQNILQGAEGLLSPSLASPSGRPRIERRVSPDQCWHDVGSEDEEHEQRAISAYANQPIGVLSGLRSARMHLEHDLLTARDAFIAVQGEILESGSPGAAAAAVARYAPTVILRPVIGASRAVGTTLLGVGNQIDRQNMRRMDDKYKRR